MRPTHYRTHPGMLADFYATARPGFCAVCEEPNPPRKRANGRPRKLCGHPLCLRAYRMVYGGLRRQAARLLREFSVSLRIANGALADALKEMDQ